MFFIKDSWPTMTNRSIPLTFIALCLFFISNINAQVITPYSNTADTCATVLLENCNDSVTEKSLRWTDDGTNDGNYQDDRLRSDTIEFCPKDQWHRVQVVFSDFDLDEGDTLYAFDGNKKEVREKLAILTSGANPNVKNRARLVGIGSGSGVGVYNAFGGWIDASCSPWLNPSGCLTFIFKTDDDNNKGAGWDAWVDCSERELEFSKEIVPDTRLKCEDTYVTKTILAPYVFACGDTLDFCQDTVRMLIQNQHGVTCVDTCLSRRNLHISTYTGDFSIGQYSVEFLLKADPVKSTKSYFAVQAPSLVCNDDLNVPLGAACMAVITPDDLLEQPCDTIAGSLYFNITITLGSGKDQVVLKTTGHDNMGKVTYPVVTVDDIKKAGLTVCGGTATARIERIYYADRDGDGKPDFPTTLECDNGIQSLYCETTLNFSDQDKPWIDIVNAPDTLIACDTTGLAKLLAAKGIDNCDTEVAVSYTVTMDETDPCFKNNGTPDTTHATVVFSATDDCGNTGTASKRITIIRPDLQNPLYIAKTKNVLADCAADAADYYAPGLKIGVWENNEFKVRDTITLSTEDYVCGYILIKSEEVIPATDCGKKKYIYWDALDWCESAEGPSRIDTTFIEYIDTIAPMFAMGEGMSIEIELDHFSCTYDASKISKPIATDNCDENPNVRLDMVSRIEDGQIWPITEFYKWAELDCDSFEFKWVVADDCHEQPLNDTLKQIVVIKDVTKPSAHCVDQLNVSVPNEWGARVYVDDIDAGSYDACGIASRLIRIKGTDDEFAEYVTIGCEYVHPDLQIEMKVTDHKGNYNICWLDVAVEDKINPYCEPLQDVLGDCEEYHSGSLGESTDVDEDLKMEEDEYVVLKDELLDLYNGHFGNPATLEICEDNLKGANCGTLTFHQEYQLIQWPCGEAKIKRRYRAVDWSGNTSNWIVQNITITAKQSWKVTFPADWEGKCGDMAPAEAITILNGNCDILGYEVTERQFDIPGDACFKIERTYHVINWCKYVAGDDPVEIGRVEGDHGFADSLMITSEGNENYGYWTYIQVLKIHDDEAPVVTVINPEPCINGIEFDAIPYGEEDNTPGAAPFECDEEKTWTAVATDCSANINWIGKLYNVATGELVAESTSDELTYIVSNKETYYAEFWAYDNCGNSAGAKGEEIKFWDCRKPTPYVLNGVVIELMPTGMVQIWASDLDQASFDNCTDQSDLDFRIWADFMGAEPTDLLGVLNLGRVATFNCFQLGNNNVNIYAIDEEGNWDFAKTFVLVQDNMDACGSLEPESGGMVAGQITNPSGETVEDVEISITGGMEETMTTGSDGKYMFQVPAGEDYTVTPTKDIDLLNGVSTFDLVLISKHILGLTTFDSPYKYIAADVNKSGTITAFDMVQLRQLILNIRADFPSNDSWRFVDAAYEFTTNNPANEAFGEMYSINNHSEDMENMDFIGVKIGDINGNAQANSLLGAESRNTFGTLTLTTADRFVEVGELVTVTFNAQAIEQIQGYQFTLDFAGTKATVLEGTAKAANFNTVQIDRGKIAASWNGETTANQSLFSLTFNATANGLLSELMNLNSTITPAEAYNQAGELLKVELAFTNTISADFVLSQNTPNPFNGETVIDFNLPVAGQATLQVMDAQGKVLKAIQASYPKGQNTITLKANELGATGVLYYQLSSANHVATKKMIIIE